MRIRDVYLKNALTLADSDTVIVDLTRSLKILYLRIIYQATNGATSNTLCKLNGMVSKLAVIDGSTVFHSLSMSEELGWNAFQYGRFPYQNLSENDADVITEEVMIDFRRYPGDTQFYLDTSKYINPQLQLTHAFTISATAGFATGTGKLSVIARVIDSGAPSQLGFMTAKEIDSFSSASSGDHLTELPLDFPISSILVSDPVDGNTADTIFSNFKLTADTDNFIPVNMKYLDLIQLNAREYGQFEQTMFYLEDTGATLQADVYNDVRASVSAGNSTAKAMITSIAGNTVTVFMTTGGATGMGVTIRGNAPRSSVIWRFGDGWSPDQVFNPQGVGKLNLLLTMIATGATPKVVVAQLHP